MPVPAAAMSNESLALSTVPPPAATDADDYDVICATVMESARGRWFLNEYAKRARHAETTQVLAAIARIEDLIRERSSEAYQSFRAELLEMARAIAESRIEAAASTDESRDSPDCPAEAKPERPAPGANDNFATAERIKDVAWTMRERGFDPATCDQIEQLASSILSAAALRDPDDGRAHKLADVLGYLERRIDAMLASVAGVQVMPDTAEAAGHAPSPQVPSEPFISAPVETPPVQHADPAVEAAATIAPDTSIDQTPLAAEPVGRLVELAEPQATEREPDPMPPAMLDARVVIESEPAPQEVPHPAGELYAAPSPGQGSAPLAATSGLAIERNVPAASQDTTRGSAHLLDLDDLVPPNEFDLAPPPVAVAPSTKAIADAGAAAPDAVAAKDIAATPVVTATTPVSLTNAYDVSPVEFVVDTNERVETPAADVPPAPPAAPHASAPAGPDVLALAGQPIDVLREIEQELFVVEAATPPEPAPAAPAPMAADPPQPMIAELRPAANARSQPTENDPLAALKALSDEERIALFT